MASSESQHAVLDVSRGNKRALDGETSEEDGHVGDGEVTAGDGERVDGGARGHDREVEVPVWLGRGGDEEAVDRGGGLREVLGVLDGMELFGAQLHGLVLLAIGAGEDDDFATHLGGELDGQVAETANADDTDALVWLGAVHVKGVEDGGTTAHEWSSGLVWDGVWDLEQEGLLPDGAVCERSLVEVGVAVHGALWAESLVTGQALLAVAAGVVLVAPTDAVALLQVLCAWTDLLDDTDTLVTEDHVGVAVVLVSTAETGGGDLEKDLVILELAALGCGGLDDLSGLGALEDGEGVVRHVCEFYGEFCCDRGE